MTARERILQEMETVPEERLPELYALLKQFSARPVRSRGFLARRAAGSAGICMLLIVCLLALPGDAQNRDSKPQNVAEATRQFRAADAELNRLYQQCTTPEAGTVQSINALKQAQKLWIPYRDANAAAYQTNISSRRVQRDEHYIHAQTVITRSRIREMRELFLAP